MTDLAPPNRPQSHDAASKRDRGWKMALLFGVRGFAVYTEYPHRFFVVVGPWAVTFGPWSRSSRYGNGSHWHSGWHRWAEEVKFDA